MLNHNGLGATGRPLAVKEPSSKSNEHTKRLGLHQVHKNGGEGSSLAFSHSLEPNPSRNHIDLEQGSWEELSLREGELLFEVNETGKKMTIGGEG